MLFATAGSRLFIAPDFDPDDWTEIGEVEAIGSIGVEWDTVRTVAFPGPGDMPSELVAKTYRKAMPVQIIMGNDPADLGQAMLRQAVNNTGDYLFRLTFPDGGGDRVWSALVVGLAEVFDSANSLIRLQADLITTARPMRGA